MTMGFKTEQNSMNKNNPIVDDSFTSAICYGRTGSGKTTGFILPNIENRIKLGHGVLVYDFKGNLHSQVKLIAKKHNKLDDVYEVGKPWGEDINLLDGMNTNILFAMFDQFNGRETDYWTNAAKNLLSNIYGLILNIDSFIKFSIACIKKYEKDIFNLDIAGIDSQEDEYSNYAVNLKNIYTAIRSNNDMKNFIEDKKFDLIKMEGLVNNLSGLDINPKDINKFNRFLNKSIDFYENLSEYHTIRANEDSVSGKFGVLGFLSSTMSISSTKRCLNNGSFNIPKALLDGKIVIINTSSFGETLTSLLNITIYQKLKEKVFYKNSKPVTIFLDEAHKILNSNYLPEVDVCRESRFEYIFSTQDEILLTSKLGKIKAQEILRNIVTQYSFITNIDASVYDTHKLNRFEYINILNQKKYQSDPMFLDDDELFKIEHLYQSNKGILKMVDFKSDSKYILIYSNELEEFDQVYVKENSNEVIIEDLLYENFYHESYNDDSILEDNETDKKNKDKSTETFFDSMEMLLNETNDKENTVSREKNKEDKLFDRLDILEKAFVTVSRRSISNEKDITRMKKRIEKIYENLYTIK